jgi:hypothetical protein
MLKYSGYMPPGPGFVFPHEELEEKSYTTEKQNPSDDEPDMVRKISRDKSSSHSQDRNDNADKYQKPGPFEITKRRFSHRDNLKCN